jgi:hypothetical protein
MRDQALDRKPGSLNFPAWAKDDKRRQLLQARRGEAPAIRAGRAGEGRDMSDHAVIGS